MYKGRSKNHLVIVPGTNWYVFKAFWSLKGTILFALALGKKMFRALFFNLQKCIS